MEREMVMARKWFSDEDVIRLLHQIEVETASGAFVAEACWSAGVGMRPIMTGGKSLAVWGRPKSGV